MARRVAWQQAAREDGMRLDVALTRHAERLSRSSAQDIVRAGMVSVDGQVTTRSSRLLRAGESVEAVLPDEQTDAVSGADVPVSVVYEDEHIVVVDKPSGISVHPGSGHTDDTLVNGLLKRYPQIAGIGAPERPGVVHRLDLDTSGLLVFALTEEAFDALGRAMRRREIRRTYTALVQGHVKPPEGTVEAPVGRDPAKRTRQAIVEGGKPARTHYRLVETVDDASLLEVTLDTGRMHQIRVHMAAIGFPVLGDPAYGRARRISGLSRQFLHASRLELKHPVTGKEMRFESPLPEDLRKVLEELREAAQGASLPSPSGRGPIGRSPKG